MRRIQNFFRWLLPLVLLVGSSWTLADPPSRVARLAYVSGSASFSPGGERDWGRAIVNRPLVTGDRLWVERGARAELQMGTAALRLSGATSITLLNFSDRITQVELTQGTLNVRIKRLDRGQIFEVNTPNLAYAIQRPGNYRIEVDADGDSTIVMARQGLARVYGEGRAFITPDRQGFRFYGAGLQDFERFALGRPDDFDRWTADRDRRWDNSPSRRYVSADMIGYADLDQHGTWRKVPDYGMVWSPTKVAADWAPYRDGHWSWVEPWGWTWVDDAPWGFAPSHYGRWTRLDNRWSWVPGPTTAQSIYAPALVAFVGSGSLQAGASGATVAWFPLGPRDVYRPAYAASPDYFYTVNSSNSRFSRNDMVRHYEQRSQPVTYTNQTVPGAIVAVLAAAFTQSRPVARETVRISAEMASRATTIAVAPVAPVQASIFGSEAPQRTRPPERTRTRPVVAQVAPPPPPLPFATRQKALAANAGQPLDAAAIAALRPAAAASAPAVKVVPAAKAVAVPAQPASGAAAARGPAAATSAARGAASAPVAAAPAAPPAAAAPAAASAPTAAASAAEPAAPATPVAAPATAPAAAATAPTPAAPPASRPVPPNRPVTPAQPGTAPASPAAQPALDAASARAARQRARDARGGRTEGEERRPVAPASAPVAAPATTPATAPGAAPPPTQAASARDERQRGRDERQRGRDNRGGSANGENRRPGGAASAPAPAAVPATVTAPAAVAPAAPPPPAAAAPTAPREATSSPAAAPAAREQRGQRPGRSADPPESAASKAGSERRNNRRGEDSDRRP